MTQNINISSKSNLGTVGSTCPGCHCSCHITQSSAGPCSHCQPLIELLRKYGKSMEKEMATLALETFY